MRKIITRQEAIDDSLVCHLINRAIAGVPIEEMEGEIVEGLDIQTGEEDEGHWQRGAYGNVEQRHIAEARKLMEAGQ